ncbi:aa3 type cytochrome c oxidase subunit IV [Albimonas donghaensis]|uniref:Aa3 type cytochrome c oxidase subunit IV n=1 Tax=Albimonas donghaensis TaxID=356660 RepID=A0A1H2VTH9_9RHOB|nr:aa3-type cytochrome c oxidase subunit IV [Albimonas donghaensis]MAS42506.1 aa3-type cytochrome c oxidase subunit IV [Paracoccaceae bacterium]MBR29426.1 aa3-type cytochrome c oxidase subunit IV [Paracoccaceae bacterium]SDW71732.1 aa3 type cytochrome c oxidase subunit IV [Albimonas donghaensis]
MADNHDAPHFEPGKMDIKEQEKTFEGFLRVITIGSVLSIATLIFMALVNS